MGPLENEHHHMKQVDQMIGRHWSLAQAAMSRQGCEVRSAHQVKQHKGSSGGHLLTRVVAEENDMMTWQNLYKNLYSYILVPDNVGNILCIVLGASWLVHFRDAKSAVNTLVATRRIETQRLQVRRPLAGSICPSLTLIH